MSDEVITLEMLIEASKIKEVVDFCGEIYEEQRTQDALQPKDKRKNLPERNFLKETTKNIATFLGTKSCILQEVGHTLFDRDYGQEVIKTAESILNTYSFVGFGDFAGLETLNQILETLGMMDKEAKIKYMGQLRNLIELDKSSICQPGMTEPIEGEERRLALYFLIKELLPRLISGYAARIEMLRQGGTKLKTAYDEVMSEFTIKLDKFFKYAHEQIDKNKIYQFDATQIKDIFSTKAMDYSYLTKDLIDRLAKGEEDPVLEEMAKERRPDLFKDEKNNVKKIKPTPLQQLLLVYDISGGRIEGPERGDKTVTLFVHDGGSFRQIHFSYLGNTPGYINQFYSNLLGSIQPHPNFIGPTRSARTYFQIRTGVK